MIGTIQTIDTPDGAFTILTDDEGRVLSSGWTDDAERILERLRPDDRPAGLTFGETDAAVAAIAYYEGEAAALDDVAVLHHGTPFQHIGWATLREIEPGNPLTYSEFAATIGSPSAVRAAASICARNAPALFVPCHRVLRASGALGGFAWGLPVKQSLLDFERGTATLI